MQYTPPSGQNLTLNFGGAYAPPSGAYLNIEYSVVTAHIRGATVGYVPSTQFSTPDIRSSIAGFVARVGGLRYQFRLGRPSIKINGEKLRPVGIAPPEFTGPEYVSWRRWVTVSTYLTPRDPRPPRIRFDGGYQGPVGYNLNLNWEIEGAYNAPTGFNLNLEWGKVGYNQARGVTLGHTASYGMNRVWQEIILRPQGIAPALLGMGHRLYAPSQDIEAQSIKPLEGFGEQVEVVSDNATTLKVRYGIPAADQPWGMLLGDYTREFHYTPPPFFPNGAPNPEYDTLYDLYQGENDSADFAMFDAEGILALWGIPRRSFEIPTDFPQAYVQEAVASFELIRKEVEHPPFPKGFQFYIGDPQQSWVFNGLGDWYLDPQTHTRKYYRPKLRFWNLRDLGVPSVGTNYPILSVTVRVNVTCGIMRPAHAFTGIWAALFGGVILPPSLPSELALGEVDASLFIRTVSLSEKGVPPKTLAGTLKLEHALRSIAVPTLKYPAFFGQGKVQLSAPDIPKPPNLREIFVSSMDRLEPFSQYNFPKIRNVDHYIHPGWWPLPQYYDHTVALASNWTPHDPTQMISPKGWWHWLEGQQIGYRVKFEPVRGIFVSPWKRNQDPTGWARYPADVVHAAQFITLRSPYPSSVIGRHKVTPDALTLRPRGFARAVQMGDPLIGVTQEVLVAIYAQGRDPTGWANFQPEVWSTLQYVGPTRIPYTQIVMGTPEKARNVYERLTPISLVMPEMPWRHFVAHHLMPAALHNAQQWGRHVVDYDWPRLKPKPIVTDNWGPRHVLKWDEFIKPKWLESPRSRFGRDTTIDFYSQRVHVDGSIVSLEFTPDPKAEENPSKPPVIHFWEQEIDLHKQVMWGGRRLVGTPWVSGGARTVYVSSFNKYQIGEHALPPTVVLAPESWESTEPFSRKHILSLNGRRFITPVHQYHGGKVGDPYIMQPEQYIDLYRHKWGGSVVPWAKVENVQQHIIVDPYKNNGKVTSWPTFGPLVDLGNPVVRFSGLGAPSISRWHNIRLAARRITVRMEQDQWAVSEPIVGHWEHKVAPQSWDSFTSTKWNVVYVYGFNLPAKGIPSQEAVPVEHTVVNADRRVKFYGPRQDVYGEPFVAFAERTLVHKQPLHANRAGKPIVGLGEHFVRPKGWWDWWDWTQFGLFRVEEKFTVIPIFSFNSKPLDWFGRARIYNRDREITPDIVNQPQFSPYAHVESSTRYLVPSTWTSGVFGEKRHTIGTVNRDVIVRQPYPETVIGRHTIYYNQPNLPYTREINLNKLDEQGLPPENFDPENDSGDGISSTAQVGHPDFGSNVIDLDGEGVAPGRMGRVSLWTGNIEPRWSYKSIPFGTVIVDRVMRIWVRGIDVKIKVSENHEVLPKRIFAPYGDARPIGYTPDEEGMMMDAHLKDPMYGTSHPWFGAHDVALQHRTVKPYGFRVWYKYGNQDRWSVPDVWQQDRVIRLKGFRVSRFGVPVIPNAVQYVELGYQDFPGLGIGNKVPLIGTARVKFPEPLADPIHRMNVKNPYDNARVGDHEVNFFHKQVWVRMPRESTLWGDKTAALHPRYIVADQPMDTLWGTHWVSNQIRTVETAGWNSCSLEDDNFEDFRFPMRVRRDDGGVQRISPNSLTPPYVMYPRVGDGTQWVDCQGFSEYTSGVAGASPSAHLNASWLIRASGLEHRIEVGRSVIVGLNLSPKGINPSTPGIATATELCGCGDTAVPVAGRVSSVVTIPAVRYS